MSPDASDILVVDDDPDARAMLSALLERVGYGVTQVANGQEALDWLTSRVAPRLILLDLAMPVMDGIELLAILRSYSRLSRIPVIVISGDTFTVEEKDANVVRFFRKPTEARALLAAVQKLAARS